MGCGYAILAAFIPCFAVQAFRIWKGLKLQEKYDPKRRFTYNIANAQVIVSDWNSQHITPEFRQAWRVCTILDGFLFVCFPLLLLLVYFRKTVCE